VSSYNTSTLIKRKEDMLAPLPAHVNPATVTQEAEEVSAH